MRAHLVKAALLLGVGFCAGAAGAQDPAATDPAALGLSGGGPSPEVRYSSQVVPVGTPVRLMFLSEMTSRKAITGQRFKMRVDEPVYINGSPVIPVGASAWGEITTVDTNGSVGRGGRLAMRILYLDLAQGRLPLKGELNRKGGGNGAGVAMAVVGFGLLGLLTAGDSARFKGGDIITVYVDNAIAAPVSAIAAAPTDAASTGEQPASVEAPKAGVPVGGEPVAIKAPGGEAGKAEVPVS
ncbi:MAG: hypothetical protein P0Y56_04675 [Candidatus Andeanibacterium colombiense]|uniref:Uncharacterized protein n=1 Tax=Candidatus Andeanibacterium colombiense TaxID=3121345 RepID=A0AAJ5X855_9SPHN|nr:MAG: hypothetical protein P0Y56_04675 [Sphingomonadaceae bacterium]